ncbi:MAG: dynamin family protein [Pseudomonadota bacterium]
MDWETTRGVYLDKLEKTKALLDGARVLCSRVPHEISPSVSPKLEGLGAQMDRQLKKLRDNQFHVAVIGLEKAGKSVLLNAWLGVDILPRNDERCTYTATELWSAPSDDKQYLEIEYYSAAEFNADLSQKKYTLDQLPVDGRDRRDLEEDVKEILGLEDKIRSYFPKEKVTRTFLDIKEIRDDLRSAIASDRAHARAVKRMVISTVDLLDVRDIVFHDVPGFNSPVEMHKKQAENKLAECDAVIYAKSVRTPSLDGSELHMLDILDDEDPAIKVGGKAFVALTLIDQAGDAQHLRELKAKAIVEWRDVPPERILPVCAPARLFTLGTGGPDIMRMGPNIMSDLARVKAEDGIDALKEAVNAYIDTERTRVVARRCDNLISELTDTTKSLLISLEKKYPEQLSELEMSEEDHMEAEFNRWWAAEWKRIKKNFNDFYLAKMMPKEAIDSPAGQHSKIESFKQTYDQIIDERLVDVLPSASEDNLEKLYAQFGLSDDGTILPQKAHQGIRDKINKDAMVRIEELSNDLAFCLESIIDELADYIVKDLLWGLEAAREPLMVGSVQLHQRMEHGLSTLFLRFARPAINLFLETPRGTEDRKKKFQDYERDASILSDYYEGTEPSRKLLRDFLLTGKWVAMKVAEKHVPLDPIRAALDEPQAEVAKDLGSIVCEIRADVDGLRDYLKNSVFLAAGFKAYCNQELDRVRRRFHDYEDIDRGWYVLVRSHHRRGHPGVRAAAPDMAVDFESRRRIVKGMSELRELIEKL